jgi:hypothetical protein
MRAVTAQGNILSSAICDLDFLLVRKAFALSILQCQKRCFAFALRISIGGMAAPHATHSSTHSDLADDSQRNTRAMRCLACGGCTILKPGKALLVSATVSHVLLSLFFSTWFSSHLLSCSHTRPTVPPCSKRCRACIPKASTHPQRRV